MAESEVSGLSYLGDAATLAEDPLVSRGEFIVSTQKSGQEMLRMLRAESSGLVTLYDFTNLAAQTHQTGRDRALFPRFLTTALSHGFQEPNFTSCTTARVERQIFRGQMNRYQISLRCQRIFLNVAITTGDCLIWELRILGTSIHHS